MDSLCMSEFFASIAAEEMGCFIAMGWFIIAAACDILRMLGA
jgi:hypothetical protein